MKSYCPEQKLRKFNFLSVNPLGSFLYINSKNNNNIKFLKSSPNQIRNFFQFKKNLYSFFFFVSKYN